MRLLSQLGAHHSRLKLDTAVSNPSYLPLPASISRTAVKYFSLLVRRNRFSLVLASVFCSLFTYFLLIYSRDSPQISTTTYEDHKGRFYGSFKPANSAVNVPVPDPNLPIRVLPPTFPHPSLPRSLAFSNPWPDAPEIVKFWLSVERLGVEADPEIPKWPGARKPRLQSLEQISMVQWSELFRPRDYKEPVRLDPLLDSERGRIWPKIQKDKFDESLEDVKVREARQRWVKMAFLHAWRGYKLVHILLICHHSR